MAEVRGPPCVPTGWKVEVRVRKTGRKDRYYTDPVSGYIFRSLKDIERYLVSGKIRRRMKSKSRAVADGKDPMLDVHEAPVSEVLAEDSSEKKCSNLPSGSKKGVQRKNLGRNGKKKPANGASNSNRKSKSRKISKSRENGPDDFFILDSDQGGDVTNELGLPSYPEIIDLVRKSEDGRNAKYLSVPEIALVLGRQTPLDNVTASNRDCYEYPKPLLTRTEEELAPVKTDTPLDSGLNLSWGEMCSDPCIEFAIRTLTGAIPIGSGGQKGLNTAANEECPNVEKGSK